MRITPQLLKKISPTADDKIIGPVAQYITQYAAEYGVDTPLRMAHFLAQACHESAHFRTLYEYWGPTAAQKRYEGRKDLGNTQAGDGYRYRGRGIFQLTGRDNYRTAGAAFKKDFEGNPDLVADPENSVLVALDYWRRRKLNVAADKDDVKAVTRIINGGQNGLADRVKYTNIAKAELGVGDTAAKTSRPSASKLPTVLQVQQALNTRGFKLVADNVFGPKTSAAIRMFQKTNKLQTTGKINAELAKALGL